MQPTLVPSSKSRPVVLKRRARVWGSARRRLSVRVSDQRKRDILWDHGVGRLARFGTVFSVTSGGSETVLHSFTGAPGDGRLAASTLHAVGTNLYGTTVYGGANDLGTVFKFTTPGGPETPIYSF